MYFQTTKLITALAFFLCSVPSFADDLSVISQAEHEAIFTTQVKPLLTTYCLDCHSGKTQEGELNLEQFTSANKIRKNVKPWQSMIIQLKTFEMPPKDETQPTAEQRKLLINWTQRLLDDEARSKAGDPGRVPLRRLSNTEYNNTIRDLTGIDLQPTKTFPADGAAGEGFTNAAEALSISPVLMSKYVSAAKEIASHAVLLPEGFRFSAFKSKRDWTDESLAELRKFYWQFTQDGNLPLQPYLLALVRHRDALRAGTIKIETIASQENLSLKYLKTLWLTLTSQEHSYPLDHIRAQWETAKEGDVSAIVAEVFSWRENLWNFVPIGSYRYGNSVRQVAKQPNVRESQSIKTDLKLTPGQSEVVLYLSARQLSSSDDEGHIVWHQPRFEGKDLPTLFLRDYEQYGQHFEIDYSQLFGQTESYLSAAVEAANNKKQSINDLAEKYSLDEIWLKRWISFLDVKPMATEANQPEGPGRIVPEISLHLLNGVNSKNEQTPAINGWKKEGSDLPVLATNSSDRTEHIPGRISPHMVAVHPTPTEFIATVWESPFSGQVRITAKIAHAHPSCGNGVAWWLEKQTPTRSSIIAEGTVDLGKSTNILPQTLNVHAGEKIFLAIDARDKSHVCDLTEITFTIAEIGKEKGRTWDLATDIANNVLEGNPHADSLGNKHVWSFVYGSSNERSIKSNSLLDYWREAVANSSRKKDAMDLAKQIQALLTSARPTDENPPDRLLYDGLVSLESPLLKGVELTRLTKSIKKKGFGLAKDQFGKHSLELTTDENSLVVPINQVIEIRLPTEIFRNRQFTVEGKLPANSTKRVVQLQVSTTKPNLKSVWDANSPVVAVSNGSGHKQFLAGLNEFRRIFPPYICYPHVIPLDETVCLKTFHREDEPLIRLFLDERQTHQINNLWNEHRFITKSPVVENEYLPLFIGFVTQDQPKQLLNYFESQRPVFKKRAEEFIHDYESAAPAQLKQLFEFTDRAFRRPLLKSEEEGFQDLYNTLRNKNVSHEEAFRGVLARVFISPSYLLHLEQPPVGKLAGKINDWELASRLSYFLWSSFPDEELRQLAVAGRLHEPEVLETQVRRMLKDNRVRALAIEFGTQWIHVRGFDELKEKNETLFPEFDITLRKAIYEESILFFQDLFQNDRAITQILDADYTFLNEALAKHYGIPGITGEHWQRIEGVKEYGRGGILGFASVQAKQAGASRTSPVLRGNWVVETLLGEKLPLPPPNVPQLPESETGNNGLSMRQVVEKHVSVKECAICHQRIDPFGFALEEYDPIGRLREKDLGGLLVDSQVTLQDGTEFEGISGLRNYLLTTKKDTVFRLFNQRLLGYAIGRSVTLADQILIDKMTAEMKKEDGVSKSVLSIVMSKQFQMIRGRDYSVEQ